MTKNNINHHHRQIVLLLRHCFRSTKALVKECPLDDNEAVDTKVSNLSDFIKAKLPDFGVPVNWCTPFGLDIIQQQGRFLASNVALKASAASKQPTQPSTHIRFHLISDTSHRDVDTAMALSNGMKEILHQQTQRNSISTTTSSLTYSGLDSITLAQELFKPEGTNEKDEEF